MQYLVVHHSILDPHALVAELEVLFHNSIGLFDNPLGLWMSRSSINHSNTVLFNKTNRTPLELLSVITSEDFWYADGSE